MKDFFKVVNLIHIVTLLLIILGISSLNYDNPEFHDYALMFSVPIMMLFLVNDIRVKIVKLRRKKK